MEKSSLKKIAIIGAESTGKSILCEQLARHFNTIWVPEYARTYFNDSDIYNYTLDDLKRIAIRQLEMEEAALLNATRFLFCDTAMITIKIWAELEFGKVPEDLEAILKQGQYDHYLITDNSIPWEADAQRQNKFSRDLILEMNVREVLRSELRFNIVSGLEDQRLKTAISNLDY
jgi:NadR type nicotinamide-nucleotide adenylyltransferase